jgi:NTE family protein
VLTKKRWTGALVLGGGGLTGAAWELGLIAGLAAKGVDFAAADLIVGTSGGAVTRAQLSSGTSPQLMVTRYVRWPTLGWD